MGYNTALGLKTWANEARNPETAKMRLGITLEQHLCHNHYPPVPSSMVTSCEAAIMAYNEQEPDREIDLPAGITWRGQTSAPAIEIIRGHHLEAFLEPDLDEDDYYPEEGGDDD